MIRQTELLQKRAILLKLHDIFEYQSLLFTYDYLNNKLPSSFDGIFPKNRDVLNYKDTRQSDNLFVPNFSSKYAQKLPAYHLPKLWNKWIRLLPDSNKRYSIKNSIKSQILQTYQEYVNKFKKIFKTEPYLINQSLYKYQKILAKFRLSTHRLRIETARYNSKNNYVPPEDRLCPNCHLHKVEDEEHFFD